MMIKISLAFMVFFSSCATNDPSVVSSIHPKPGTNKGYLKLIKENSKYKHVSRTFETIYKLNLTKLSPNVLSAFDERFQKFFLKKQELIIVEKNQLAFFVSIFAPNSKEADLANKQEWFVELKMGKNKIPAQKIVRLKKSGLWSNFFSYVDDWSEEFLLYFDTKSLTQLSKAVGEPSTEGPTLTLSNSQAKTTIYW